MLQHEPQEQPTTTEQPVPAAQRRVTSKELARAINALEARKEAAASELAGTVPIGQVVDELKLEATPEQIWDQVQKQRQAAGQASAERAAAQKADENTASDTPHETFHRTAREVGNAAAQAILAAQAAVQAASAQAAATQAAAQAGARAYQRPRHHWRGRGRGRWWAFFGIGCAIYGVTHGHLLNGHTLGSLATSNAVIRGDNQTMTSSTAGKDMAVVGNKNTITLLGNCPTLTLTGSGSHVRVEGTAGHVIAVGSNNTVVYTQGGKPSLFQVGDGNRVGPSAP